MKCPVIKPEAVAEDILETTMLSSALGGTDSTIAKLTKRAMRFDVSGSIHTGDLAFTYTFPSGSTASYSLLHGTFNEHTGFQAAAFIKTVAGADIRPHSCVKMVFPGTARRHQFSDPNVFDAFWFKRVGNQLFAAEDWLQRDVMPRLPADQPIEINSHCLGTLSALWTKAFLRERYKRDVEYVSLLEPTSPGLIVGDMADDLASIHDIEVLSAAEDLFEGVYSLYVEPHTIVAPLGIGGMWDTAPVGERSFKFQLPPTKLTEELLKATRAPVTYMTEVREKLALEIEISEKEHQEAISSGSVEQAPKQRSTSQLLTRAFFRTNLGTELVQQFFKNHYLLSMTARLLDPSQQISNLISSGPSPDARAMLAHRTPSGNLCKESEVFRRFLLANIADAARDLGGVVTSFCVQQGRRGVPSLEPRGLLTEYGGIDAFQNHVTEPLSPSTLERGLDRPLTP